MNYIPAYRHKPCKRMWHRIIRTETFAMEICKKRVKGALRPVDQIRQTVKDLGSLWKLLAANNSCNYREDASNLLKAEHEALQWKVIFSPRWHWRKNRNPPQDLELHQTGNLRGKWGYNDAVVALSCLYVEFILQQEAGWCNWIAKAKAHLKRKQALG